jgi:cobalt-zinc-cadmium efflux system membrane fusion protein
MNGNRWLIGGAIGIVALALAGWLMLQGVTREPVEPTSTAEASKPGAPKEIALSAEQVKALSLQFARARQAAFVPIATVPAMIAPPPNARVAVAAQLPGVVTRVFVVEGQDVRSGQLLATVSSRDIVSLSAELARARARLDVARANAARLSQLSKEGIVAPARADEANALFRQAQIDVSEQSRLIGMANGSSAAGFSLTAPIGGRISMMSIETGKALDPGAAPFVIDAGGAMQAQAQLPERLIGKIQPGMTVRAAGASGKVLAVGSAIDPETRSASLTASLDGDGPVRAGQALSLAIMGPAPEGAVRVPAPAIAQLPGGTVVFVRSARGVIPRAVTLAEGGEQLEGERIILSGLKPGEEVVATSVSELKALATAE